MYKTKTMAVKIIILLETWLESAEVVDTTDATEELSAVNNQSKDLCL